MTARLLRGSHEVVVHDPNEAAMQKASDEGARAAHALEDLASPGREFLILAWIVVHETIQDRELHLAVLVAFCHGSS